MSTGTDRDGPAGDRGGPGGAAVTGRRRAEWGPAAGSGSGYEDPADYGSFDYGVHQAQGSGGYDDGSFDYGVGRANRPGVHGDAGGYGDAGGDRDPGGYGDAGGYRDPVDDGRLAGRSLADWSLHEGDGDDRVPAYAIPAYGAPDAPARPGPTRARPDRPRPDRGLPDGPLGRRRGRSAPSWPRRRPEPQREARSEPRPGPRPDRRPEPRSIGVEPRSVGVEPRSARGEPRSAGGRPPGAGARRRTGVVDRPLRMVLGTALTALLIVALVVAATKPSSRSRSLSTRPTTPPGGAVVTAPTPSTTAAAGVTPTTVAPARAAAGCGFSFGGPTGPAAAPPAAVGQCTVLEIGDSIGNDIGWGLARHVAPTSGLKLVQLDKSASGLAVPSFYDWRAQLPGFIRQYQPDLVLISIGADDEQGMTVNGSAVQFPTPAWKAEYLARVTQLITEATASGAFVLWVGLPIMQQPTYSAGIATLNSLFQQAVRSAHNAAFLPTWSVFANPSGAYQSSAAVNGASAGLRQSDGIHLNYAGEDVVATYVLRQIAAIYHVAFTPTNPAVVTGW